MENECNGCLAYRNVYGEEKPHCGLAVIPYISSVDQCPCMTCIVKVICDRTCEEFKIYGQRSNRFRKENDV